MQYIRSAVIFGILLFLTQAQVGCSRIQPKANPVSEAKEHSSQQEAMADATKPSPHHEEQESQEVTKREEKEEHCNFKKEIEAQKKNEAKETHHAKAEPGVSAEKAYGWLQNGNIRYRTGKIRNDGQTKNDRQRLVGGQKPHAIVLSCSDSRVPPEALFDQKLGEIFVVRTAGEALDKAAIASIEYAVDHLGPQLLVVMAHESCGAVKAAFGTLGGTDAGSPSLNALVKDIHPRIRKFSGKEPSEGFRSEAKANASGVAQDLVARSKIIEEKVQAGELRIETALYHLDTGAVEFFKGEGLEKVKRGLASEH